MEKPDITCYLKPTCGWSNGVRAVLRKYDLEWDEKDVVNNPEHRAEMIERSGQMLQPCVEINGHMLADVSGDEVEAWMLANNIAQPTAAEADAPTDQPCAEEMPQGRSIQFKS
jgi:monothiol glutaredoxin|tara:strand:- start:218 stop:556 length:339 start_codon:yes stop_codon:yes gene_type:complete